MKLVKQERIDLLLETADKSMAQMIKDLPNLIRKNTMGSIAQMLGFRNSGRYDRWEIDHCNGRTSDISNWISHRAKKIFVEECDKILTKKFIAELVKEAKNGIRKDLKERFIREVNNNVITKIQQLAQEESNKIVESMKLSIASGLDDIAAAAMEGKESSMQLAILETECEAIADQ